MGWERGVHKFQSAPYGGAVETHVVLESAINTEISRSTEGIGLQVYRMMGPGAGAGGV